MQFCKANYKSYVLISLLFEYSSRDKTDLDVIKEEHRYVDFHLNSLQYHTGLIALFALIIPGLNPTCALCFGTV